MTKLLHLLILQSMYTGFILSLNFFFFFQINCYTDENSLPRSLVCGHLYDTGKSHCLPSSSDQWCSSQDQPDQQERGSALNGKSSTQSHICSTALTPWKQQLPLWANTLSHSLCFINRVWLKGQPVLMGQRRKKEGLVSRGTRQKKEDMVAWDKGEDLTRWKGSEVGEDPVWREEGPSETSYCSPLLPNRTKQFPQSPTRNLCLPISDGSMASTLPSLFSVGFAFPSEKAKRFHSQEIPLVTQSCKLDSSQMVLFIHSFTNL